MLFSIVYQWTCFIWMVERSLSNDSMLPLWVLNTVKINLYLVYKLMLDLLLLQGFDSNILAINSFLHLIAEYERLSVQSSTTTTVCCRCLNKLPATQIITLHQSEMSSQLISSWVAVFLWALCTLHTLFWAAVKQGSSKCISIFSMNPLKFHIHKYAQVTTPHYSF